MNSTKKRTFSVCRVCLAFDMKMYSLGPQISEIFEKVTKTKIYPKDGKPRTVCYICFSLLKRCLLFANMSHLTEGILNHILLSNPKLTRELVMLHSEGIVNNFYATPIVTCSVTDEKSENVTTTSIVKGSVTREPVTTEPVTIKTEKIDEDQAIVEISGIKKQKPSILEDEIKLVMNKIVTRELVTNKNVTVKTENVDEDHDIIEMSEVIFKKEQESILEKENKILMNESVTRELVTNKPVTVKTENVDDDKDIVEMPEVKQEQESFIENENDMDLITNISYEESFENEELIEDQMTENEDENDMDLITNVTHENEQLIEDPIMENEQEVDLEEIVSRVAQNIENEQAVFGNETVFENEAVIIKLNKDYSTKDQNKSTKGTKPDKHKMDDIISELTQEIEDGISAIENEELIGTYKTGSSEDCIIILSDEDVDMSECDEIIDEGDTIIVEDDVD